VNDMAEIAPMLSVLGYDPYANPPVYGAPDSLVSDNTRRYVSIRYTIRSLHLLCRYRIAHEDDAPSVQEENQMERDYLFDKKLSKRYHKDK
jgi:hypothetical protein